ncbi:TetR/AcrR family transcriptional regulator [Paracoccus aerius]|uniref:TetR/AcrR family transcriptional regulator n=1 Tax=Paracoccus aerius TaxID=1915382 RepID=A0ABS1S258_9RHOB|nr:TetR/AcrR family transcriptional regulator [Paracoccus aerius]MBL3672788.1 TetR/AcrR family transcriptional regulator [Paracoccus aerius]GHG15305.1 TetR family transcriptional regulator [Paracoccus aerius]
MAKCQAVSPGRKFDQVIRGATAIFLRDGFAGASVDDIAAEAQVSKATLYSYFPDKTAMFQEAMRAEAARLEDGFALDIDTDLSPDQALPLIIAAIAAWMADPARINFLRLHLAEAGRCGTPPGGGRDRLVRIIQDAVQPHLDRWARSGQLAIEDTGLATRQLVALSLSGIVDGLLFDPRSRMAKADTDVVARSAAQLFLRAFMPASPPERRRRAGGQ